MAASAAPQLALGATSLFPQSTAVVIGLPASFDFGLALRNASSIRLATAFAHLEGWKLLENDIVRSHAQVYLLTGLHFCQTEPKLLSRWWHWSSKQNIHSRLAATMGPMFHPKVLIVESSSPHSSFAIVGSGNLSIGGLRSNIECGVYLQDDPYLTPLTAWFDGLFNLANPLTEAAINEYAPKYKNAHKALSKIRTQQKTIESAISHQQKVIFRRFNDAVSSATSYFETPAFTSSYNHRVKAAERIRTALKYPNFGFDRAGWVDFFNTWELGRLRLVYRDDMFRYKQRLRSAFTLLVNDAVPIEKRLSDVLVKGGTHHVSGLGLNVVSKVLAVHDPSKWPVFNKPVERTLQKFGYEPRRGSGQVGRYLDFANSMQQFMQKSSAKDVFALDSFFYWYYSTRKKRP